MSDVVGLVLAAGAGRRFGGPKALARDASGRPWLQLAHDALAEGGCPHVTVVLGAGAEEARSLVPDGARVVVAPDWQRGQSASLAVGLRALPPAAAVAVTLVDLPGQRAEAVARVVRGASTASLRRAVFAGRPGHPVLLGRDHWSALLDVLAGDEGARPYLRVHDVTAVDCTDLGGGQDVDR
ncbi:nucleotidyltransferase family protein [Aeromicrobium sp. IC_218]|uniref:nucleotidyltransferase family protein n=1 Tax=Aeromicrobium sp. IC_218 TaxID=2545468 RepID=UPI00103F8276|nr:nucleotidyltransferase family protein [Aeromicrobium sp. IC_218]TCI98697.1 nucleotidyltransferase family protein [Aeromicrobium sp. IC_218]